jgi:CubicO group peptidase (beta-lactamase class C family)
MRRFTSKALGLVCLLTAAGLAVHAQGGVQVQPGVAQLQLRAADLPRGLTPQRVQAHVLEPAHVRGIQMEEVDPSRERLYKVTVLPKVFKTTPQVDLEAFGKAMHAILKDNVTGYILQVRKNGNLNLNLIWNWAQTPADASKGWNEDTRMHVASVSKWLTAVGMVKTLDEAGISYDTKISGYLPSYWSKGAKINQISFRQLLQHRSGFDTDSSSSSYGFMKQKVADGVSNPGSYDYENMNFGLCRILMPIIQGKIKKDAKFIDNADLNDKAWDAVTLLHYHDYMNDEVFGPAGVNNASFMPLANGKNAYAYKFPAGNDKGWDSGNLQTVAGGAGWRVSTKELLNVMNHVRRKGTVIPASKAQYILDNNFGIDQILDTPAGKMYNKNGGWNSSGRKEQCVAYFFPNGMECAVYVNSKIGADDFSLRGLVKDCYVSSLQD